MAIIRRARADDAAALAELAEHTFREAFAANNDPTDMDLHCRRRFGADIQAREIGDAGWVNFVAEADGELIGFAQARLNAPTDCVSAERSSELYRIYVLSSWHGRGIAQRVMEAVLDAVSEARSDRIWLGVWEQNPRAMAFYRKYGFEIVGAHRFLFGTEYQQDLIMAADVQGATVA